MPIIECTPNMRMQPMPLRVNEIGAILAATSSQTHSRSIGAARLMRQALGRHHGTRTNL